VHDCQVERIDHNGGMKSKGADRTTACSCVVLLLAGLLGCGKTTHLHDLQRNGWSVFDDFKAGAIDDSPEFRKSLHFAALLARLHDGFKCVVADIDFCKTESRAEAERVLRAEVPGVEIGWRYFSHDEQACEANIKHRNRASLDADLRKLRKYSSWYLIPEGADVLPVASERCS
jgi:hypothetical protein